MKVDKPFSIERFEANVSQSTVPSPPLNYPCYVLEWNLYRRAAKRRCPGQADAQLSLFEGHSSDAFARERSEESACFEGAGAQLRLELRFLNSSFSSSRFSIRAFRAYPLIEGIQTILYRAIRGKSISVNSTLPLLNSASESRPVRAGCHRHQRGGDAGRDGLESFLTREYPVRYLLPSSSEEPPRNNKCWAWALSFCCRR